ncbi:MAG: TetR/AcrR family transcriptional regulator [Halioglobus sp.]
MNGNKTAPGHSTRQINKELRRQRILLAARDLIASQGFDAFTISELASMSGVSIPTVHNLFGKKQDIVQELFAELVARIDKVLAQPDHVDPVNSSEVLLDSLLALYRDDEAFYRAAFMAGERLGLFEHEMSSGIFRKSLQIAERLCIQACENGFLLGRLDSGWMAEQLFGSQRLARQDWVGGYITLERFRQQALVGMLMTYAADATPEFHSRICNKLDELGSS